MATTTVPQPLKWAGGKSYLARKIAALLPPHVTYVEPYAGGLSVLLEKDPANSAEIVNDLNGELTNFWRVLQAPLLFERFQRIVEAIPFSEAEFLATQQPIEDATERAVRFFVRCRQSRTGSFKSFATLTKNRLRRGMQEQASAWLAAIDGLPAVHARLRRVVILNRDAIEVIRQHDAATTAFYVDPPYVLDTRSVKEHYEFELKDDQHVELLDALAGIKGRFLLSGYRCPLYDEWAARHAFRRADFDQPNQMAGGRAKDRRIESVWMNY
jgi:DNA adenine methylase